ncbi:MAG: hypothetical protein BroJett025_05910 [Patescibacteria group bacterium]|nr:MAG: hypothetical protein BroJett025_05910 [Patescibacteria group bacterium]
MKAETAAIIAVFGHVRNSNVTDIHGSVFRTRVSYSWQDKNHEVTYTLSIVHFDQESERIVLEVRSNNGVFSAELQREATQQYSINFSDSVGDNSDVVPWFKIDKEKKYIRDGYHQNADPGEEGPFSGLIELSGLRAVLKGYYDNEEIQYTVKILK